MDKVSDHGGRAPATWGTWIHTQCRHAGAQVLTRLTEVPAVHWVANAILVAYFVALARKQGCGMPALDWSGCAEYATSFVTLNLLIRAHGLLLGRWRRIYLATLGIGAISLVSALGYHHARRVPLDYATVALNIRNGFGDGILDVVVDSVGVQTLVIGVAVLLIIALLEWWRRLVSRSVHQRREAPKALAFLGMWVGATALPLETRDPMVSLARSFGETFFDEAQGAAVPPGVFPYVNEIPVRQRVTPTPTVFLIMMESLNARFIELDGPKGEPIMPVFRSLIPRGAYFEWFYGNSIQTSKGHAATLLGILPSKRHKILMDYGSNCFRSLPAVLREHGYATLFAQAYADLGFERGDVFYKRNGFEQVLGIADSHGEPKADEAWGWGLRDDVFYHDVFEQLDRRTDHDKPLFVTLAPVSNHVPFDKVPDHLRSVYPDARERDEHYANSVHLSDQGLATFFEELSRRDYLQNSLVIITGDHSFPTGEHGYTSNVDSYEEEFFRTGLLIIWPNHIKPERVKEIPYSQVDIAPTLLELLGIGGIKHHFVGRSVFDRSVRPVLMVQPYSGRYVAVVDPPYKFVHHDRSGREFLFNLIADPQERHNLLDEGQNGDDHERLKKLSTRVDVNERLLMQNQIWPCNEP